MIKKTLLYLMLLSVVTGYSQVPIGNADDGTSTNSTPIAPYYGYSYAQSIYLASEINASGDITSLDFQLNPGAVIDAADDNVDVWIGTTSKSSFEDGSDWVDVSTLTQVLTDGTVTSSDDLLHVVFDTPFTYNGTDNLIIAIDANEDGLNGASDYLLQTVSSNGNDLTIYYNSDSTNSDPTSPEDGSIQSLRGNIIINGISQSCPYPNTITVNDITTSSATISWTAGGDENEWEIKYGAQGFDPETEGTSVMDNDGTLGETIEGLTPGTIYDVYVKAICSEEDESTWYGPVNFPTACTAINTFPYVQHFDNVTTPNLPICWEYNNVNEDDVYWQTYTTYGIDGSQAAGLHTDFNDGDNDDYLVSPQFTLTGNEQLRFSVRARSTSEPNDFKVMLSTTGNTPESFTEELMPLTTVSTTDYQQYTINLDEYSGDVYIAIYVPSGGLDGFYLYMDDFIVRPMPTCLTPTDMLVDNVTTNSTAINWTPSGDESEWEIKYGAPGFDPETEGTSVSDNDGTAGKTVEGLDPQTEYELYVRAICGADDQSEWAGPVTIITDCAPITSFPYIENFDEISTPAFPLCWEFIDGNEDSDHWQTYTTYGLDASQAAGLYTDYNDGDNDDYLVSPQFTLTGNEQLRFSVRARSTSEPNDFKVMLSTTGNTPESFTEELMPLTTVSTTDYQQYTLNLDEYSGDVYIAFYVPSGGLDGYYLYMDDFIIRPMPDCLSPTAIVAGNVTANSTEISWTASGDESEWEILYGETGFDPATEGTSVADNDDTLGETLNDLEANTTYELYVRAICGEDNQSEWAGPISFTTECNIYTPPHLEDFSEFLPECWEEAGNGTPETGPEDLGSGNWSADEFLNTGDNNAVNINLFTNSYNEWLISPSFDLSTGGPFQLKYTAAVTDYNNSNAPEENGMGSDDEVQVLISEDDGTTWTTLMTYNQDNYPSETGAIEFINLDDYSGTVKFAFWATDGTVNDAEDYDFFIDDFEIRPTPSCLEPSNVMVTDLTFESATVTWTPNGEETEWEILYGETGFDPTTEGTSVIDNDGTIGETLEGLSSETEYDVYVRAICGESNESAWTGPTTFYTWYCTSEPSSNDGSGITNVQVVDTDFPNEDVTYNSFTDTPVDIQQETLTNLQITFATGPTYDTNIWIDLNDNLEFEENELVFSGESANDNPTTFDASFTITADAPLGNHIMRIGTADFGQATPNPCYSGSWGVTLDFTVNIIPEACPAPTDIQVAPSDNYAEVSWTESGEATSWTLIYGPEGFDPETEGTEVIDDDGQPETILNNLDQETTYDLYIHANCDEEGSLAGPVTFTTIPNTCLAPSDIQINQIVGPTAEVTWVENGTATEWEIEYGPADFEPGTGAGTIVTDNDGTLGETLDGLDPETEYDVYVRAICEGDGTSNWAGPASFISDVSCPVPSNIFITGINGDSVNVSWTENGLANEWEIEYGPVGFEQGQGTTVMDTDGEIGIVISGLDVNTEYDLYIRSVCGENETSLWFGPISFTTATTGLIAQSFDGFVFYPNPVNDQLNLRASANIQEVEIYNLLGQRVIDHKSNDLKSTIDVTKLQAGAYLMKVTINGYAKTFKLIKE